MSTSLDRRIAEMQYSALEALRSSERPASTAKDMVIKTRDLVEDITSLELSCNALQDGITYQLDILKGMTSYSNSVIKEGENELNSVHMRLSDSDQKLNSVMQLLSHETVLPSFQQKTGLIGSTNSKQSKSLNDYVDHEQVDALKSRCRKEIDTLGEEIEKLRISTDKFDSERKSLESMINERIGPPPKLNRAPPIVDRQDVQKSKEIPNRDDELENDAAEDASEDVELLSATDTFQVYQNYQAHEIAEMITGMAEHFDKCNTAMGFVSRKESGKILSRSESTDLRNLTQIIEEDENELDNILDEMMERADEMRDANGLMSAHYTSLKRYFDSLELNLKIVGDFTETFKAHTTSIRQFTAFQKDQLVTLLSLRDELENFLEYYSNYAKAYEYLILELNRRHESVARMEEVIQDALDRISLMDSEELEAREQFRKNHGQYLPTELWPGIADPPPRWEIHRLDDTEGLPDVTTERVEQAYKKTSQ